MGNAISFVLNVFMIKNLKLKTKSWKQEERLELD